MGLCLSSPKPAKKRAGPRTVKPAPLGPATASAKDSFPLSEPKSPRGVPGPYHPGITYPTRSVSPNEQLDYTSRVTIKGHANTGHKLLNSYAGEIPIGKETVQVTVKALRKIGSGSSDTDFTKWTEAVRQRLKGEISVWKKVDGPGSLVPYIGIATVDDVPAVLTQFVDGTSATEYTERLSVADIRPLILEFADALKSLHSQQLRHGSIEPQHFIVDKKGKAKLTGFAFDRMVEEELEKLRPVEEYRRSARYTPPETLEGKPTNDKSDVYSFACVALELMTRNQPFHTTKKEEAVIGLVLGGKPQLVKDYAPLEDDPWFVSLERCLTKDVEARPSMAEVYDELSGILKNQTQPSTGHL
ncbi:hypothetical protein M407DRAFT_32126 [Tulasnella calospora MUT 4182]|uniref:Protein kinase domain-containing protein n=1 Tax=Tulasnella calospora MUT 4182 TaxID=1051891 RepID=A0A0C3Q4I5_9AGAM|nr:hypothetical protein M407DRAFT_32126 [Tulasnella calospora MUT 4182]